MQVSSHLSRHTMRTTFQALLCAAQKLACLTCFKGEHPAQRFGGVCSKSELTDYVDHEFSWKERLDKKLFLRHHLQQGHTMIAVLATAKSCCCVIMICTDRRQMHRSVPSAMVCSPFSTLRTHAASATNTLRSPRSQVRCMGPYTAMRSVEILMRP